MVKRILWIMLVVALIGTVTISAFRRNSRMTRAEDVPSIPVTELETPKTNDYQVIETPVGDQGKTAIVTNSPRRVHGFIIDATIDGKKK